MNNETNIITVTATHAVVGTEGNPAPTVFKLGVDVHLHDYVVVEQAGHSHPKPPRRMAPSALLPLVEKLLAAGHEVHVVQEACGFGYGVHRALEAAGAHSYVVAPQRLDARGTRVKTDGRDARELCLRLTRYLAGNRHELAVIRVPSEKEEQQRAATRQREQLVRARKRLQAQGRSALVGAGIKALPHWWRATGWKALQAQAPAWLVEHLAVFQPVLLVLDEQLAALTLRISAQARPGLPAGVGALTSEVLRREVCDWGRFRNRREVSAYTGLCPGEYSSGDKRVQGSVSKHGNPQVRATLVELAWRLVRFQPQCRAVRPYLEILAKGSPAPGSARKKAIVAVARRLAVDLWRLETGATTPEKLGLSV
jgi:transposase